MAEDDGRSCGVAGASPSTVILGRARQRRVEDRKSSAKVAEGTLALPAGRHWCEAEIKRPTSAAPSLTLDPRPSFASLIRPRMTEDAAGVLRFRPSFSVERGDAASKTGNPA
ncbi:hypothetical protein DLM45_01275 [Hyphomicrobium methylovorum]|nr:hypothetical protein [Hyphomicrobium methylovorum]